MSEQNYGSKKFTAGDYPSLFRAANEASIAAQRTHIVLTTGILVLLVAGAGLAAASPLVEAYRPYVAMSSALFLTVSLTLSAYLKVVAPERTWYGGRAVAESVKSMAWRYMTGANPYPLVLESPEVDTRFMADMQSIVKERRHLAFDFAGESNKPHMSERMRSLRAASLGERLNAYVSDRISDQRQWYGEHARSNCRAKNKYFALLWGAQFLALLSAIALVRWPDSTIKLTGLFTSLASAFIAWTQVKQYQELAQSYAIAELELGFIEERARYIGTEEDISAYVIDSEKAISREHTLWIARRDRTS